MSNNSVIDVDSGGEVKHMTQCHVLKPEPDFPLKVSIR